MENILVVIALIFNKKNQLLIAKRPEGAFYGGFWEFPGGKVEKDEPVSKALARELKEEVGIKLLAAEYFSQLTHQYPEMVVNLEVWRVEHYDGIPYGCEGQHVEWCDIANLKNFKFLEATKKVIETLIA